MQYTKKRDSNYMKFRVVFLTNYLVRCFIAEELSPVGALTSSFSLSGVTSTCMSILSSSGPEILDTYFLIIGGALLLRVDLDAGRAAARAAESES